ncbi:hypothetical protein GALMADRAFT_1299145 [Galerina marginata CBS 339.88]|uniref:Uncharacterized protein n=1 Tax=Galerina marginata (strain CBS 339.88) TaxID=685588 RepID=A0A067TDT8_GALM3|nr:hypothetical protein GALMADRAFT_1299145 [Galerina marginata CBS 339.88]
MRLLFSSFPSIATFSLILDAFFLFMDAPPFSVSSTPLRHKQNGPNPLAQRHAYSTNF